MKVRISGLARLFSALGVISVLAAPIAHASTTDGLTRAQVRAQLNQAFLNGTLPQDEGPNYPAAPINRAEISAHRHYEETHGRY